MSGIISGNMVGGAAPLRTLKLVDSDGTELLGVVVDNEVVFTADADNDIRNGKIAATDAGVVTGTKIFPFYTTWTGKKIVPAGSEFKITLATQDAYDYTELQCIICPFNSSMEDSVSAEKVVIGDNIYDSNSTTVVSTIAKDINEKSVRFNVVNSTDAPYIIRYFTYKEIE